MQMMGGVVSDVVIGTLDDTVADAADGGGCSDW